MKRALVLTLTALALASSFADAGRRSGGGFGGSSRSSSSSSSSRSSSYGSSGSSYRSSPSRSNNYGGSSYGGSSYSSPSRSSSTSSSSRWNIPSTPSRTSTPTRSSTPKTTYPSNAAVKSNPLNTAAAAKVTPTQLSQWNKLKLPAGVNRSALTYSAAPSTQYRYQLQPGRYYPYPQSYYRQHNIGYDLFKYALIFTAVSSIADAMTPNVVVHNSGYASTPNYPSYAPSTVVTEQRGPGLWPYLLVGLFAALAGWFVLGRRRG